MGTKKPEELKRTRQVLSWVQPSVYADYKKVAHMLNISANELTNTLFKKCVADNKDLISEYNRIFNKECSK